MVVVEALKAFEKHPAVCSGTFLSSGSTNENERERLVVLPSIRPSKYDSLNGMAKSAYCTGT